jgi:hypothetical protein
MAGLSSVPVWSGIPFPAVAGHLCELITPSVEGQGDYKNVLGYPSHCEQELKHCPVHSMGPHVCTVLSFFLCEIPRKLAFILNCETA